MRVDETSGSVLKKSSSSSGWLSLLLMFGRIRRFLISQISRMEPSTWRRWLKPRKQLIWKPTWQFSSTWQLLLTQLGGRFPLLPQLTTTISTAQSDHPSRLHTPPTHPPTHPSASPTHPPHSWTWHFIIDVSKFRYRKSARAQVRPIAHSQCRTTSDWATKEVSEYCKAWEAGKIAFYHLKLRGQAGSLANRKILNSPIVQQICIHVSSL